MSLAVIAPWERDGQLSDGRPIWRRGNRTLLQRPDGEWAVHTDGSPARLGLGTDKLEEAMERADWTSAQWDEWRESQRNER